MDNSVLELALWTPNLEKEAQIESTELKLTQQMGNLTQYIFLFSLYSNSTSKELRLITTPNSKAACELHNQLAV